jgi:hypothetical protein
MDGVAELYHGAAGKQGAELTFDRFFPVVVIWLLPCPLLRPSLLRE